MKRLFVLMSCAMLLSACATRNKPMAPWVQPTKVAQQPEQQPLQVDAAGYAIENIPFRAGVSSATVEKLARAQGCTGGQGAGLTTPQGPVEMYRMMCDGGFVFTAKCELRQCRTTSTPPAGGYAVYRVAADSNVYIATETGTKIVRQGGLARNQVPRLVFEWKCGECTRNEKVPPLIAQAYEQAAIKNGFTVSDGETASVSIVQFRQRIPAMRAVFGIMAGRDNLSTRIDYRGQSMVAEDYMVNAWVGMNGLSANVGKKVFEQLRPR